MIYNRKVVETLSQQISDNDLEFYWFITLEYHYKNTDLNKVRSDNKRFRYTIRKFFKSNIRMWFFNEKHHTSDKIKGGYHRHILMESIPEDCWKTRSNQMDRFLLELDPEILFGISLGKVNPTCTQEKNLLDKVIRGFNNSLPNGKDGVDIRLITKDKGGVSGLLEYNTKDSWKYGERIEEVIDWENSDCLDIGLLARQQHNALNSINSFNTHSTKLIDFMSK
jgi:hypothetical protein